jgi:hypothetical protein
MPKRKQPELDPKEQFKRFQEAAKRAEVDEHQADKSFTRLAQDGNPDRKRTSRSSEHS